MTTTTGKPDLSDEAIEKGSGKTWAEWVDILDAWGAAGKSHTQIARHVAGLGVGDWWAQSVTVGYERIKGLRVKGQVAGGYFAGSASRTFPVPVDRLSTAWTDDAERDQWLAPGTLTLRTAQEGRSARFDAADGTGIVALWFTDKGEGKSSVQIQNETLPSQEAAVAFRATWKAHFANLAAYLKEG
jgi:uncharacterized protein YndB with AHSA1/START domain